MRYLLTVFFVFSFFTSCHRYPKAMRDALYLAGDNRVELEKVLDHYSQSPADSLKYRAACFLIENMPYHTAFVPSCLPEVLSETRALAIRLKQERTDISTYRAATIALDSMRKIKGHNLKLLYNKRKDLEHIKADYLIADIDLAFQVKDEMPWGKRVDFRDFCELILPYRISNETVKSWRLTYYNRFKTILDSLPPDPSLVQACKMLYDELQKDEWYHVDDLGLAFSLDPLNLLEYRFGSCREKAEFTLYAMRALCIPGSLDMFIQTPDKMYAYHYWNQMKDSNGFPIEFLIRDNLPPIEGQRDTTRKKGVIYRLNYAIQSEALPVKYKHISPDDIPERMKNIFLSNVSGEYRPNSRTEIDLDNEKNTILYLCLFNNREWIPIAYSEIKQSKAVFKGLEPGIVYLPAYYVDKTVIPASAPFLTDSGNCIHYLLPDTADKRTVVLERKHPLPTRLHFLRRLLIGGRFEGANRGDFRDGEVLSVVLDDNELKKTVIRLDIAKRYRYIRYLSAEEGKCNMAELQFFSSNGKKLEGCVIGTDESRTNPASALDAVFDKDPLTYYQSGLPSGSWVGLDFGQPQQIGVIVFQFRNDDNLIREGDLYELFYFSKEGFVSLGIQTGTNEQRLVYDNVPENALLWLRNHTRGREERIFTYEKGKQVWW
jgi:hypothetical protein